MKGYVFHDITHAIRYLVGCIILINDRAAYIRNIIMDNGETIVFQYLNPASRKEEFIKLYHPNVDLSPVPLGWVNLTDNSIAYASRFPVRDWHVGLHPSNFSLVYAQPSMNIAGANHVFMFPQLANCIEGKYPSFKDALEIHHKNNGANYAVAFSRSFALSNGKLVKGVINTVVGGIKEDFLVLSKNYSYMLDKLVESGIKCELSKNTI